MAKPGESVADHEGPSQTSNEAAVGPQGVFSPIYRPLTIGIILSVTVIAYDGLAVSAIMPNIVDDIGGLSLYGWAFSAFMLSSLVGTTVAGLLADRKGPALPYVTAIGAFAAGLLISGLAVTMPVLILGRAVQGFGGGAVMAMAYVGVGRGYPESLRPRMMAVISTAWVIPSLVGPGIATELAVHVSWRLAFLGLLPLLTIAVLSTATKLTALRRVGAEGMAGPGRIATAFFVVVGTAAFLSGLNAHSLPWSPALLLAGVAVGAPALRRLLPAGTLRLKPGYPASIGVRALLSYAYFGIETFIALALTRLRHTSTTTAGLALTAGALGWTAGAWLQVRLDGGASPMPRSRRIAAGIVVQIAGTAALAAVCLTSAVPPETAALCWAITGFGMGMAHPMLNVMALESAADGHEGEVSAAMQTSEMLMIAVATGIGGALVSLGDGQGWDTRAAIGLQFLIAAVVYCSCLWVVRRVGPGRGR